MIRTMPPFAGFYFRTENLTDDDIEEYASALMVYLLEARVATQRIIEMLFKAEAWKHRDEEGKARMARIIGRVWSEIHEQVAKDKERELRRTANQAFEGLRAIADCAGDDNAVEAVTHAATWAADVDLRLDGCCVRSVALLKPPKKVAGTKAPQSQPEN